MESMLGTRTQKAGLVSDVQSQTLRHAHVLQTRSTRVPFQTTRRCRREAKLCKAAYIDGEERPTLRRRDVLTGTAGLAAAQVLSIGVAASGGMTPPAVAGSITPLEATELGHTGLQVSAGGIGCWSWGDRSGYWGYDKGYNRSDNEQAYNAVVTNGFSLVDTAEVYGFGLSEEILGAAIRQTGIKPFIATKFAPLPWRFSSGSVEKALRGSLDRLGVDQIGLYQMHWPGFLTQSWSNDAFVQGLAGCVQKGLTKSVGVSNFREDRIRRAVSILEGEGQKLASNQVQYSLAYRVPETNGVVAALRESGSSLVAYSPLCQGLLTGKYTEDNLPTGPRAAVINKEKLKEVAPLLAVMREISEKRGKTLPQIAINWTLCKGAIPIPGAKNTKQVNEAAGAFGWRLAADEVDALDMESSRLKPSLANPVENF